MKSCIGCVFAEWKRTAAGKLHPSGDGKCTFVVKPVVIPACMYYIGRTAPLPNGGHIDRHREFKDHCPCYQRERAA